MACCLFNSFRFPAARATLWTSSVMNLIFHPSAAPPWRHWPMQASLLAVPWLRAAAFKHGILFTWLGQMMTSDQPQGGLNDISLWKCCARLRTSMRVCAVCALPSRCCLCECDARPVTWGQRKEVEGWVRLRCPLCLLFSCLLAFSLTDPKLRGRCFFGWKSCGNFQLFLRLEF